MPKEQSIASRISQCLLERGLSRVELARKAGISYVGLFNILDRSAKPRMKTLVAIAGALATTPRYLQNGGDPSLPCSRYPEPQSSIMIARESASVLDAAKEILRGEKDEMVQSGLTAERAISFLAERYRVPVKTLAQFLLNQIGERKQEG
jgi:transcriptional regulator with XRE-family HTH domain